MCNHIWKIVNDVRVCVRCGITVRRLDGKILFDRNLPNAMRKGQKDEKTKR